MAATAKPIRKLIKEGAFTKKYIKELEHPKYKSPTASEKKHKNITKKIINLHKKETGSKLGIKPLSTHGEAKKKELIKKIPKSKLPKH
jgi:hypothetical protein